ncbi:MAG: hypothetical protein Q9164_002196 [Protoblastenia rupestris]
MPVTITPATHGANAVYSRVPAKDSFNLLERACHEESTKCVELLQSSFDTDLKAVVDPSANGFVHGAIRAYSNHHHLQIRPEDVWFAIISQLSFYINCHAEELRELFVAHEGKKELVVTFRSGSRYSVDFGIFAQKMSRLIEENVVDPELRSWTMPAFSTTTKHDKVIASILLMGVTQKYFDFKCCIECGLPSVTLLGEKADWELIYNRLDKLETFGAESSEFCRLLRPVVSRFVKSFDDPASEEIISFWQRIAHHYNMGSGPSYYSGWITAFCFWNADGESLYRFPAHGDDLNSIAWEKARYPLLHLDGATYHRVDSDDVPPGYSSVPVKVDDNGDLFDAMMIAGSVGINCASSGNELAGGVVGLDTINAETGWWMFECKSQALLDEEKAAKDREYEEMLNALMRR